VAGKPIPGAVNRSANPHRRLTYPPGRKSRDRSTQLKTNSLRGLINREMVIRGQNMKNDILSMLSLTGAISSFFLLFIPLVGLLPITHGYIGPMLQVYCFYIDIICNIVVLSITQRSDRDKFIRRIRLIAWAGLLCPIFLILISIIWTTIIQYIH
jgi:hypothetical protein